MRVVVVSGEGRDYSRSVDEWLEEFRRRTGRELEVLDPDSREGGDFARVYGVVEYPTFLALTGDGQVRASWKGEMLPMMGEVAFYAQEEA